MSVDRNSTRILAVTVAIFFFTTSLSGTFLPIYFHQTLGMSVPEIIVILFFTFVAIGVIPSFSIRITKHFERLISLGVLLTLLFYVALIYIKNPVILGLAYGTSLAVFWPSFNLLQFRLSESKERALMISLMSVAIPGIASIVGPAVGGFIAQEYGFVYLFAASIILFLASLVLSLKIRYKSEGQKFLMPNNRAFKIFMLTFALIGFSESYWLAYPFFVLNISSTIISMGLALAASSAIITLLNITINRLSDVKGSRVKFAIVSSILYAIWYFALASASNITDSSSISALWPCKRLLAFLVRLLRRLFRERIPRQHPSHDGGRPHDGQSHEPDSHGSLRKQLRLRILLQSFGPSFTLADATVFLLCKAIKQGCTAAWDKPMSIRRYC